MLATVRQDHAVGGGHTIGLHEDISRDLLFVAHGVADGRLQPIDGRLLTHPFSAMPREDVANFMCSDKN